MYIYIYLYKNAFERRYGLFVYKARTNYSVCVRRKLITRLVINVLPWNVCRVFYPQNLTAAHRRISISKSDNINFVVITR